MSKRPASAFRAPQDDPEVAAPRPAVAAEDPGRRRGVPANPTPEYRVGKRNLSFWIPEKAARQVKAMAAEEGLTVQEFMAGVLNREFARKNRPEIA